jgi:hypothetical protein
MTTPSHFIHREIFLLEQDIYIGFQEISAAFIDENTPYWYIPAIST